MINANINHHQRIMATQRVEGHGAVFNLRCLGSPSGSTHLAVGCTDQRLDQMYRWWRKSGVWRALEKPTVSEALCGASHSYGALTIKKGRVDGSG